MKLQFSLTALLLFLLSFTFSGSTFQETTPLYTLDVLDTPLGILSAAHAPQSPLDVRLWVIGEPSPGDDILVQMSVMSWTTPLRDVLIESTLSDNLLMKGGRLDFSLDVLNQTPVFSAFRLDPTAHGEHRFSVHAQTELNQNGRIILGDTATLTIHSDPQEIIIYDENDLNSGVYPCGADLSCGQPPQLSPKTSVILLSPQASGLLQGHSDMLTISGVVDYIDNNGTSHILRRARVELFDRRLGFSKDLDHELGSTYTNDSGFYSFTVPNEDSDGTGLDPYIRVIATDDERVLVRYSWSLGNPRYRIDSALIVENIDPGHYDYDFSIPADTPAEPFHIFDTIANLGYEELAKYGWDNDDLLSVTWPSLCKGIPYTGSCYAWEVFLDKDDGWDKDVILHEYGHFVLGRHYGSDAIVFACRSVGFSHFYGTHTSDSCAWSEGWADYLQAAIQNEGNYEDYDENGNPKLVYNIELDTDNDLAPLDAQYPDSSDDELAVTGILWDIFDNQVQPEAFDLLAHGFNGPGGNGIWTLSTQNTMYSIIDFWEAWRGSSNGDLCEINRLYTEYQIPYPPRSLDVNVDPSGGGSVSVSPPTNCFVSEYAYGTNVTLEQTANPGYRFVQWFIAPGGVTDSSPTLELYLDQDYDVLAEFELIPTPTPTTPPTPTPPPTQPPVVQLYPGYNFVPDPNNFVGFPTVDKNTGVTWGYFDTDFSIAAGSPDSNYAEFTMKVLCERYSQPLDCLTAGVWLEFGTSAGGTPPLRMQNLSGCTRLSGTNSNGTWRCRLTSGDRAWREGKPFIKLGMGCGGCTVGYVTLERLEIGNWPYALPPTPTSTPPPTPSPSPTAPPCPCALTCVDGIASIPYSPAKNLKAARLQGPLANLRQTISFLHLVRDVRDEIMGHTPEGQHLIDLYTKHSPEIAVALIADPVLKEEGFQAIELFVPSFEAMLEGRGREILITQAQVDALRQFLVYLESVASPELRTDITLQHQALDIAGMVGMNFDQAQGHVLNNLPPEASIGGPYHVDEGSELILAASGTDPEGDMLSFYWDFAGTDVFMELGPSPVFYRPYLDGPYEVQIQLKVCDDRGGCDLDRTRITIHNLPPAVTLEEVSISPEGGTVFFYGEYNDPGALDTHTILWNFGDGTTEDGTLTPLHSYARPGVYVVGLTVTDDDGGMVSVEAEIAVVNEPPLLQMMDDHSANEGEPFALKVGFDDPDSSSWSALVNYGDGSDPEPLELVGELAVPLNHTYLDEGTYTVGFCLEDPASGSDCGFLAVTVHNISPTLQLPPPPVGMEGTLIDLDPIYFTDPGLLDLHIATADWADGMPVEALTVAEDQGSGSVDAEHVYGDDGIYGAEICVSDEDGGEECASLQIMIENLAPIVAAGPDSQIPEGSLFELNSATFEDPGVLDTHRATIDWGNGSPIEDASVSEEDGSGSVLGSHVYIDNGLFDIKVCVNDDEGEGTCDALQLTVLNVAPMVDAGVDQTVHRGTEVQFLGSFQDPGGQDTHLIHWDFGDGTTSEGTLSPTHIYPSAGVYIATLTLTDDDNAIGADSVEIKVTDVPENAIVLYDNKSDRCMWIDPDTGAYFWHEAEGEEYEHMAYVFRLGQVLFFRSRNSDPNYLHGSIVWDRLGLALYRVPRGPHGTWSKIIDRDVGGVCPVSEH